MLRFFHFNVGISTLSLHVELKQLIPKFFSSCFRDCFYSQMRQELWTSTLLELLNTLGTFEVWLGIAIRLWEQRLGFKVMCLNAKLTRVRFL